MFQHKSRANENWKQKQHPELNPVSKSKKKGTRISNIYGENRFVNPNRGPAIVDRWWIGVSIFTIYQCRFAGPIPLYQYGKWHYHRWRYEKWEVRKRESAKYRIKGSVNTKFTAIATLKVAYTPFRTLSLHTIGFPHNCNYPLLNKIIDPPWIIIMEMHIGPLFGWPITAYHDPIISTRWHEVAGKKKKKSGQHIWHETTAGGRWCPTWRTV